MLISYLLYSRSSCLLVDVLHSGGVVVLISYLLYSQSSCLLVDEFHSGGVVVLISNGLVRHTAKNVPGMAQDDPINMLVGSRQDDQDVPAVRRI